MQLIYEVLVDEHEKPNKCTILPLAARSDLKIRRFARGKPIPAMTGAFLLHPEGEDLGAQREKTAKELSQWDAETAVISVVDCNWRRLESILMQVASPLPRRIKIPKGFQTAYPRKNRKGRDPEGGLATIEAIFIAGCFLGPCDPSLLDRYHWKKEFIEVNREAFLSYGISGLHS